MEAFNDLKDFLSSPPLLSSSEQVKVLFFVFSCDTGNHKLGLGERERR